MDQRLTDLLTNKNATNFNMMSEYKLLRNPRVQKNSKGAMSTSEPLKEVSRKGESPGSRSHHKEKISKLFVLYLRIVLQAPLQIYGLHLPSELCSS